MRNMGAIGCKNVKNQRLDSIEASIKEEREYLLAEIKKINIKHEKHREKLVKDVTKLQNKVVLVLFRTF